MIQESQDRIEQRRVTGEKGAKEQLRRNKRGRIMKRRRNIWISAAGSVAARNRLFRKHKAGVRGTDGRNENRRA